MKIHERRVVRVETGLTPTQAVFAWMEKAHRFPSLFAYLGSVLADSDAGYPLDWLETKLNATVSQALRGQLPAHIQEAKRAAYREAVILYHLHYQVGAHFRQQQEIWELAIALLAAKLDCLEIVGTGKRPKQAPTRMEWRRAAISWLRDLYTSKHALGQIRAEHFGGRQVLFDEQAQLFADRESEAEAVVDRFNDFVDAGRGKRGRGKRRTTLRINAKRLSSACGRDAKELMLSLEEAATVLAAEALGDTNAVLDVVAPRFKELAG